MRLRLLILSGSLILLGVLSNQLSAFQNGPRICPFYNLTDLPCPLCGTTRSIGNILLGNFSQAASLNIMGFVLLGMGVLALTRPQLIMKFWSDASLRFSTFSPNRRASITLVIVILSWAFNLPRML